MNQTTLKKVENLASYIGSLVNVLPTLANVAHLLGFGLIASTLDRIDEGIALVKSHLADARAVAEAGQNADGSPVQDEGQQQQTPGT